MNTMSLICTLIRRTILKILTANSITPISTVEIKNLKTNFEEKDLLSFVKRKKQNF